MAGQDSLRTRTLRRNGHVGSVASDTVRVVAADRSSTAVGFPKYPTARGCSLKVDSSTRNERARPNTEVSTTPLPNSKPGREEQQQERGECRGEHEPDAQS